MEVYDCGTGYSLINYGNGSILVDGGEIRNCFTGIYASNDPGTMDLTNLQVHHCAIGVELEWCEDLELSNCNIHHNTFGIYAHNTWDWSMHDNYLHDHNGWDGMQLGADNSFVCYWNRFINNSRNGISIPGINNVVDFQKEVNHDPAFDYNNYFVGNGSAQIGKGSGIKICPNTAGSLILLGLDLEGDWGNNRFADSWDYHVENLNQNLTVYAQRNSWDDINDVFGDVVTWPPMEWGGAPRKPGSGNGEISDDEVDLDIIEILQLYKDENFEEIPELAMRLIVADPRSNSAFIALNYWLRALKKLDDVRGIRFGIGDFLGNERFVDSTLLYFANLNRATFEVMEGEWEVALDLLGDIVEDENAHETIRIEALMEAAQIYLRFYPESDYSAAIWQYILEEYPDSYQAEIVALKLSDSEDEVNSLPPIISKFNQVPLPSTHCLLDIYPNPFNSATTISYALPEQAHVRLMLYDVSGRQVETLVDRVQEAGEHGVLWNAAEFPSGVYFCRLDVNNEQRVKKLALIR